MSSIQPSNSSEPRHSSYPAATSLGSNGIQGLWKYGGRRNNRVFRIVYATITSMIAGLPLRLAYGLVPLLAGFIDVAVRDLVMAIGRARVHAGYGAVSARSAGDLRSRVHGMPIALNRRKR